MFQRVVTRSLNGVEDCQASLAEHFEIHAQKRFDGFRQRHTGLEDRSSASNQRFHQRDKARIEALVDDLCFIQSVSGENVERNVDASFFEIARNVLPEIGELQRGASLVRQLLTGFIAIVA